MIKIFFFIILSFIALSVNPAFAYFDPGTGAFIIQSILAFFAVVAVYLGYPIRILKNFLSKFKKKKPNKDEDKIK